MAAHGHAVGGAGAKVGLKIKDMSAYLGIGDEEKHLFWVAELGVRVREPVHAARGRGRHARRGGHQRDDRDEGDCERGSSRGRGRERGSAAC